MALSVAAAGVLQGITRNRTSTFITYRNQRHAYSGAVVSGKSVELTVTADGTSSVLQGADFAMSEAPPRYFPVIEDIRATLGMIHNKQMDLQRLHESQFLVQIDDTSDEQHAIEIATAEITRLLAEAQQRIKGLGAAGGTDSNDEERRLLKNVQSALASQLGDETKRFRQSQQVYLTKLRKRNQKVRGTLSSPLDDEEEAYSGDKGFTEAQMSQLATMNSTTVERDKEIRQIYKSIVELSEITKDLAVLIVDQGTLLDRIDYNIEVSAENTKEGVVELKKANESQKGIRTKLCIILLLVAIMLGLIIVLIKVII
eukprot:m51a1_g13788 Syntaxin 16 (314) ;mRNA; f:332081-333482